MSSMTSPKNLKGKWPITYEDPPSSSIAGVGEPSTEPTTPPRVAFGVELEFLVAECEDRDPDADIAYKLAPPTGVGTARQAIKELLESRGLPAKDVQEFKDRFIPSEDFIVSSDPSVSESAGTSVESGYQWSSIEVSTPAQYNTEEAFDLVRLLVSLITSNFRCRVNESTGFHVHVSNGFDKIEGRHARKFGALLWAAEPILSMLHPTERAFDQWSRSIRRLGKSRLAMRSTAETAREYILKEFGIDVAREYCRSRDYGELSEPEVVETDTGDLRVHGDKDNVDWETYGYQPFHRPMKAWDNPPIDDPRFVNLGRKDIKAGPPTLHSVAQPSEPYEFERLGERSDNCRPVDMAYASLSHKMLRCNFEHECPRPMVSDAWTGILELLSSDVGTHQVAQLLSLSGFDKKNWNFDHLGGRFPAAYEPAWLPDDYIKPEFLAERRKDGERTADTHPGESRDNRNCCMVTIEAREAVGTLDPDWIVTWAKVCCGLLEFARDAETSHYMSVVDKCAHATSYDGEYDVVDLLRDMGLFSEANHCEQRLMRQQEAWNECLRFKTRGEEQAEAELPPDIWQRVKWRFHKFKIWDDVGAAEMGVQELGGG